MPLFSWGKRRRKSLATGASQRSGRRIPRAPSDAGSVDVSCGCRGASKKDKRRKPSPSDDGGIFMGTENNNKPLSASTHVDTSIIYFDDSLLAEQETPSTNHPEPGTPYERTPEPNISTKTTSLTSPTQTPGLNHSLKPKSLFIPPWIRNRRYLPSIDDVDFDQIDSISLHSYRSSPNQMTRDSPHLSMSPIYQNLIDKKLSDLYLNAQMKGLIYSSTPVEVNIVNVAPPQVMTATSEAAVHKGHENQPGISEVVSSDLHNPRTPLEQLSFNKAFDQRQLGEQKKEIINTSIYENISQNEEKENNPALLQGARQKAQRPRPSLQRYNFQNDLRRRALTRNLSYKPIREQDIDVIFANHETHTDSTVSSQVNMQLDLESTLCDKDTLPTEELLQEFDRLHLGAKASYRGPLLSSLSEDDDTSHNPTSESSSFSSSSSSTEIPGEYDAVVQKPYFADNSARQARVVNLSSSSESDVPSPEDNVHSKRTSLGMSKIGNAWSFASSSKHLKPPLHRGTPRRQAKSTINIRNAESSLAKEHKDKIGSKSVQQVNVVAPRNQLHSDLDMQENYHKKPLLQVKGKHKTPKRSIRRQRKRINNVRFTTLIETYVVIKDHTPTEMDECNVQVGDIVFVNSKQQRDEQMDWMWVMVAETGNLGYIPAFSARPVDLQSSSV